MRCKMDTVDIGLQGKYHELNNVLGQNMPESVYRKSLKVKEEKPLNRKLSVNNNPKCTENAVHHFQSFAENASIDGLKFVGEQGRTIPERIFWTITLIVALALCIILVMQTFKKWINSPVIVTFATSQTPIFEIPFPAITICPEVKSDADMFNYTDVYLKKYNNETLDEDEELGFKYMSLICNTPPELLDKNAMLVDKAVIKYFQQFSLYFGQTILDIEWKGKKFDDNGTGLFSTTLTDEGLCYTFNALNRKDMFTDLASYHEDLFSTNNISSEWSPEKGYTNKANPDSYPQRTTITGAKGGLSLIFTVSDSHLNYVCGDSVQGFKVALHHPGELPRVKENFFRLPLEQTVIAAVKPKMMTTSEDLRNYKPKERQCYFIHEKNLKFFKIYNQQNCIVECLTNFTLKNCGCVNFHMPREESTPICGPASIECMDSGKVLFLEDEVNYKIKQSETSKLRRKDLNLDDPNIYSDRCDCLPACVSLDYDVELSQAHWNWPEAINIQRQTKNFDPLIGFVVDTGIHLSRLHIFFKELQFITSERNELYSTVDFWANIGGIVGLFTGFSFVTMFEILYYLSLRLYCNVRLFGVRNWSGAPELLEKTENVTDRNKSIKKLRER